MSSLRILELESFGALRDAVAQSCLPAEFGSSELFCTLPWFENLAAYGLPGDAQPLLLLALSGDAGVGSGTTTALCLPLQHLATGLGGLSNYYSSLYGPVVWGQAGAQHSDSATWLFIARHLRQHRVRWPLISLGPMDMQSPAYLGLQRALKAVGYQVDTYFCFGNWHLQVKGRSFAVYAQTLPSPLRHSIARGQRRLTRQGAWGIHIQIQPDQYLEAAIDAFVQVYQRSWKSPEPHPKFIPQLARTAATQGWLRLGVLTLGGKAIAAQLWLVKGGKASIYKLAYVQGMERFSAGSVLTDALMQQVIDRDKVEEVDYLTGDDAYKQDWMSHRRERRGVVAFDLRTVHGLWAAARHWGGKLLASSAQ